MFIGIDVRHEFADDWHRFVNTTADNTELKLSISKDMLPFFAANKNVEASELSISATKKDAADRNGIPFNSGQTLAGDKTQPKNINLFIATIPDLNTDITETNDLNYSIQMVKMDAIALESMFVMVKYRLTHL